MSENSEPYAASLEVMAFASPLGLVSDLLGNLPRSVEIVKVDVLLEFSLPYSLAFRFASSTLMAYICFNMIWFIFFCPCMNSVMVGAI
jgi:hypothetical protein